MSKTIRELYPYRVECSRTRDWYDSGGTWYQISTWMDKNFHTRWEYLDGHLMFETEKDMMWFKLRWS
jgi:hypothetical protein